jgi:hypothetical protein
MYEGFLERTPIRLQGQYVVTKYDHLAHTTRHTQQGTHIASTAEQIQAVP